MSAAHAAATTATNIAATPIDRQTLQPSASPRTMRMGRGYRSAIVASKKVADGFCAGIEGRLSNFHKAVGGVKFVGRGIRRHKVDFADDGGVA